MTAVFSDFIRALRAADIRISPAEAIEARLTLNLLGYEDKNILRAGLSQTLAKSAEEKQSFDDTFEKYFSFRAFAHTDQEAAAASPPEDVARQTSDNPAGQTGAPGEGGGQFGGQGLQQAGASAVSPESALSADNSEDLASLLEHGDRAALQARLIEAARKTELNDIRFFTQRGMFALRIFYHMGGEALDEAIAADRLAIDAQTRQRAQRLSHARENLRAEIRDYVERNFQIFAGEAGKKLRENILKDQRLSAVDRVDMKLMQALVRKLAKRLVRLHTRRRREARRGQLDMRRTIRANIEFDGLMFHTIWKRRKIDRPKVMAICDVSGSVANVSRFLLMFLHSLHDVLPAVRSFAFSARLGEATAFFAEEETEIAIAATLARFGGASDYGQALEDFEQIALDDITRHTTILILGDARNNGGEARADILRKIRARAHRVIFLNPEPRNSWNTGDSVMRLYEPCCDRVLTCATLKDLERVIHDILRKPA